MQRAADSGTPARKRAAFHNLGCKVNSYELDIMRQKMAEAGYETVPFEEEADIYVINTCTVTNIADRKSRQMIHRAKKKNPDALVIAVGCYVETDPGRTAADSAVDLAIGNNNKARIAELLDDFLARAEEREDLSPGSRKTMGGRTMSDLTKAPEYENMQLVSPGRTRAFIKIQDGCNQFCSYCIIPYARGRIRSRAPQEILEEVRRLVREGTSEIVLTGIHISSYGLEWDGGSGAPYDPVKAGRNLLALLRELSGIEGLARIRLSSLEPRIMTEAFVSGIAKIPQICPHFHLSLQSGCGETLRRMNRHYTPQEYLEGVKRLRRYFEKPAITTDVITGFPGETVKEFEETVRFLEEVDFYEIHVFRYSVRRGTVAEKLPGQVPEAVKALRSDRLLEMTAEQAARYRAQFAGRRQSVLIEEAVEADGKQYYRGHTARYVQVYLPREEAAAAGLDPAPGMLVAGVLVAPEGIPGDAMLMREPARLPE
ncbi:MAG: tRNA (N(6)-L-threonylcarbamoyladenosine(37)-C(2))-methylthiotransferase MtaB [Lachnospiraceae bacterium]|nr:tRNA (N(6)-L-threonylcarbamoyladenosine(37)-C(2))-methylthiotransferase MtaB [Lachnospiraceae bacterium]